MKGAFFYVQFQKPEEPSQEPKERLQESAKSAEPAKSESAEQKQNAKRKEQGTALRLLILSLPALLGGRLFFCRKRTFVRFSIAIVKKV